MYLLTEVNYLLQQLSSATQSVFFPSPSSVSGLNCHSVIIGILKGENGVTIVDFFFFLISLEKRSRK